MHQDRLVVYGSERPPTAARRRVTAKLGNGADKLRWLERLFQKDAVGTPRGPFVGAIAGYVDDGKIRIDPLACLPPFVLPASLTLATSAR